MRGETDDEHSQAEISNYWIFIFVFWFQWHLKVYYGSIKACFRASKPSNNTIPLTIPWRFLCSLRKHAYSNRLISLPSKNEIFQIKKKSCSFHISAQNIDCGYSLESPQRGGSNEYPQSMFLSKIWKTNVYPCKPKFYCIKVGFNRVKTT